MGDETLVVRRRAITLRSFSLTGAYVRYLKPCGREWSEDCGPGPWLVSVLSPPLNLSRQKLEVK